ncbi:ABC transporter permease [Haloplanus aerogenes]|uniref:ABC transporter permease n=1 Tax=Haloplanus aerogenes TaxID=660522 RepID=A0A3G8QXD5_9EURY|nr:ABC transporter permease [Haloplanus aerogenes]
MAGAAVVSAVVLLVLAWYFRPWLHTTVYGVYTTPVIPLAAAIGLVLAGVARRYLGPFVSGQIGVFVFIVVLVASVSVTGLLAGEELGKATMESVGTASSLSETDPGKPRVVTKAVASRYASNTLNFPQYRIEGGDITVRDGTPYWSYALAPDGAFNYYTKRQHGTVLVDMTRQNAEVDTVVGDLKKGVGPAFYNNYRFAMFKQANYLVAYDDPFMVVHEGDQHIAVPYTKPEFHWFPLPYTTPEWGGVVLIDSDGRIEDLSPTEAREHPVLQDQKLYPFELTRQKVAATKYRNGIVNTFTSHEDEIEVAPVPGEGNDQPFLVFTEDGPEYVVAVEPYGQAQGLKEVWTVDARTGEYEIYTPSRSLFGARKATDYVRQAARTTDWNRFRPSEPIPVVVDGQLYWQVRVVPSDSSGIAYTAFVNARSTDVHEVSTTAEVAAFLRGDPVATGRDDEPAPGDRTPTIVVQRVAPNGTVIETLEVYGNETVRVVQGNTTATASG